MYISVPPVPFWSCLYQKNTTSFRMYKTVCFEHETHVKSTRRKRLRTPSRTNLRWYIAHHPRLPTLPSRKQTSLWRPAQQECTFQGAPTYPYCSKPTKIYIFWSNRFPFWSSCLHQKNITSFSDSQDCLIWTWKYISKLPGEKGYSYHPERILDDIFPTIHGFSTLAAKMYCLPSTASPPWPQTK